MPRVLITETVLRDAPQSLIQGRLRLQHVLPIAETLDRIGYWSLDAWAGATFSASIRYLQEDPWQRLSALKGAIKNTPLQMLIRGQTLISTHHQPDDVVRAFIKEAVRRGIGVVRMFDPLNDLRNLEVPIEASRKAGATVIAALVYSPSPVQRIPDMIDSAVRLKEKGANIIGIEDVAGILAPDPARELVKGILEKTRLPVSIHSHSTTAFAPITYFTAAEAGATMIDTALSSFAWGGSQPATETMVASFRGTPYDTGLDLALIGQANRYFDELHDEYEAFQDPVAFRNDIDVLDHQLPARVLADLIRTLHDRNALDKYETLLNEVVKVREEMGYPPLAAPVNQIAARQALSNTLGEKRYQHIEQPFRDYIKGLYGSPPGPIDGDVKRRALGNSEPITLRPADLLEPALDAAKKDMRRQGISPAGVDQVLTYVLFPEEAPDILRPPPIREAATAQPASNRAASQQPRPAEQDTPAANPPPAAESPTPAVQESIREYTVEVDGETYRVKVRGIGLQPVGAGPAATAGPAPAPAAGSDGAIQAPMQGMVVKVKVKKGERVKLGDVVVVLEAMKMQNDILASVSGTVREVYAKEGAIVSPNDVLLTIG